MFSAERSGIIMTSETTVAPEIVDRAACPRRNANLQIGPAECIAGRMCHFVKNSQTGKFYRMGAREVFLLEQMNGARTLGEMGATFRLQFGQNLTDQSWWALLSLLKSRDMLATDPSRPPEPRTRTIVYRQGPFARKLLVWNPDPLLERWKPAFRFLLHPISCTLLILAIVASEVWIVRNWSSLKTASEWHGPANTVLLVLFGVATFLVTASAHEFAHAAVCKNYGGEVPETGLLFRYLAFYPYARLDDIALFSNRWHRVAVLGAGTLASLGFLPAMILLWHCGAPGGFMRNYAANLLIWFNIGTLSNLVPFLELDGYFMLAHLLKLPQLKRDSYQFLQTCGLALIGKSAFPQLSSGLRLIFVAYSIASISFTVFVVAAMAVRWKQFFVGILGQRMGLVLCAAMVLLFFYNVVRKSSSGARARLGSVERD